MALALRVRLPRWLIGACRLGLAAFSLSIVCTTQADALTGPVIALSRTQVIFGRVPEQVSSRVQPVFVTNVGDAPLTLLSTTIIGSDAALFKLAGGTCATPITLPPAGRCHIDLTATGGFGRNVQSASLIIATDAAQAPPPVALTATPETGPLYLAPPDPDPDWVDFPAQAVGTPAAPVTLVLHNVTGLDFNVTTLGLVGGNAGDFALASSCPVGTMFANGTDCTMTIAFTPTAAGPRSTEIRITLVYLGINGLFTVSVTGVGGTAAPAAVNIDQHGLTGSWYQPSTDGQGVEIEVFEDMAAPGTGYLQGAWFTYDNGASGGADHGRWYTFGGNVQSGTSTATLPLYQNVGGNFDALPATSAVQVGSVGMSFTDCATAQLDFTFTDGSNRSGTVHLTRLTPNVNCTAAGGGPTNRDYALSGNWYDATRPGQGVVVDVNPVASAVFMTWYTYAVGGQSLGAAGQRWYTGQASYASGTRSIPLLLYETTGGLFNAALPAPVTTQVGTATLDFASCTSARLTFSFTSGSNAGRSGVIDLGRVGSVPAGCGP